MLRQVARRVLKRVWAEFAYQVCERLDRHTHRRTTDVKCTAANAISIGVAIDWRAALEESDLPYQVRAAMSEFTADEWVEVMGMAGLSEAMMRQNISHDGAEKRLLRKPPPE
jgi:hypothetical protein